MTTDDMSLLQSAVRLCCQWDASVCLLCLREHFNERVQFIFSLYILKRAFRMDVA